MNNSVDKLLVGRKEVSGRVRKHKLLEYVVPAVVSIIASIITVASATMLGIM